MKKIAVDLAENSYPVYIGTNIFQQIDKLISKHKLHKNICVIADSKVYNLYKNRIDNYIKNYNAKISLIKIKAAEKNKSMNTVEEIYFHLLKKGFSRDTLILAIGGGITGDIAGFVAATFMRGVQYIQIPTTILSAVDSSVGGKTGVNFGNAKNIIGAFYQPKFVLIDSIFFDTLKKEETICGIGEIFKYAFIADESFYKFFDKNYEKISKLETKSILSIIERSIKFKSAVVSVDEKESGLRKILNFGHTFAHAFEIQQKHQIKHGQAVILGISCALYLSNKLNLISDNQLTDYLRLLLKFRNEIKIQNTNFSQLYSIMNKDKKNYNNEIRFVLTRGIGKTMIDIAANKADVKYAILNGISLFE